MKCVALCLLCLLLHVSASVAQKICISSHYTLRCNCTRDQQDISGSTLAKSMTAKTMKIVISQCGVVNLTADAFPQDSSTTLLHIDSVDTLVLSDVKLPSTMREIYLTNIRMVSQISEQAFAALSSLEKLVVENANVADVPPKLLVEFSVHSVTLRNVTFRKLSEGSLLFQFSKDRSISPANEFKVMDCAFPYIDYNQKVVYGNDFNGKITFSNNLLNCTNLMSDYGWISKLFEEEMKKDPKIICYYLGENYCGNDRTSENNFINQLYARDLVNDNDGINLRKTCEFMKHLKHGLADTSGQQSSTSGVGRVLIGALFTALMSYTSSDV